MSLKSSVASIQRSEGSQILKIVNKIYFTCYLKFAIFCCLYVFPCSWKNVFNHTIYVRQFWQHLSGYYSFCLSWSVRYWEVTLTKMIHWQIDVDIIHISNVGWLDSHLKDMFAKVRELINPQSCNVIAPQGISAQPTTLQRCRWTHPANSIKLCYPAAHSRTALMRCMSTICTTFDHRPWWASYLVFTPWCPAFATPAAQQFNQSVPTFTVPQQLKTAIIKPWSHAHAPLITIPAFILSITQDICEAKAHVTATITACLMSLSALCVLRAHDMTAPALHSVYRESVLAKLLYCKKARSGFCSAAIRDRIHWFFSCSKRSDYCWKHFQQNCPYI